MPLYAYRCTQCGHRLEKIQNFSAEPETVCPKCGGVLERPLTAPRLHFKGAGWYVNDYAAKSSEPAADGGSGESGKAEAKPAESKPAAGSGSGEGGSSAPTAAPAASSTPPATPSSSASSSS